MNNKISLLQKLKVHVCYISALGAQQLNYDIPISLNPSNNKNKLHSSLRIQAV